MRAQTSLRIAAVIAVFLLDPAGLGAQSDPPRPVEFYRARREAMRHYESERWEEAEAELAGLVQSYPEDPELWFRLARARHHLGRSRPAIRAYRESFDRGFRYGGWIPMQISRLHARLGARDSSLVWLDRALSERWDDRAGLASDPANRHLREDPRLREAAGELPKRPLSRDEGWRFDIRYLTDEVHRMHVTAAGDPDVPSAFDSLADRLHDRVPDLSNDEILLELGRLMATLGDGHTGIYGPDPETPLTFEAGSLPLLFYDFDDGLYVIDAAEGHERWIGSRVLAFGAMPAEQAVDSLPAFVHHDNAMTVRWLGVRFQLPRLSFLGEIGAADSLTAATLTLRVRDGGVHRATFTAGDHVRSFRRKLRPVPGRDRETPLYLEDVDEEYRLEPLPEVEGLYFQFNQVRNAEDGLTVARFADSLRSTLVERDVTSLIIDVRHNNGGNNGLLRPLVQTLVWWAQGDRGRRIFVITGRNTFSAAQNFVNRVERWTDAVFVGEPSASRPNFSGEETPLLLPFSRVRGSISNRHWQDSDPDDRRPWIAPDMPVRFTSEDYFEGRDPALEAIVRLLGGGPPGHHSGTTPMSALPPRRSGAPRDEY